MNSLPPEIIPDGPINADKYHDAPFNILHWLKEPTLRMGIGSQTLSNDPFKYQLWRVTARRTYALLNGLPSWSCIEHLREDRLTEALASTAVLNMNNTIPVAVNERFNTFNAACRVSAKECWKNRRENLEFLLPHVIICGGTFHMTTKLFTEIGEPYEISGCGNCLLWKGFYFVKAYHPSFRNQKHEDEYDAFRHRFWNLRNVIPNAPWK